MNDSIIIKSNDLIQKSNYQLRYHQMRVLLYAISQIKRGDNVDQEYSISIKDAGDILGLDVESGGIYYKIIKETFLELTQREWGITPYGSLATISWISDVEIFPGEGMISFRFHAKMQPYLFDMKERYTQYNLEDALAMESSTSLRLFELVKSKAIKVKDPDGVYRIVPSSFEQTLEEIRAQLGLEGKYESWSDLERYALRKGADNINSVCKDIHLEYLPVKKGRRVASVKFMIQIPNAEQLYYIKKHEEERAKKRKQKLEANPIQAQLSFFDNEVYTSDTNLDDWRGGLPY